MWCLSSILVFLDSIILPRYLLSLLPRAVETEPLLSRKGVAGGITGTNPHQMLEGLLGAALLHEDSEGRAHIAHACLHLVVANVGTVPINEEGRVGAVDLFLNGFLDGLGSEHPLEVEVHDLSPTLFRGRHKALLLCVLGFFNCFRNYN